MRMDFLWPLAGFARGFALAARCAAAAAIAAAAIAAAAIAAATAVAGHAVATATAARVAHTDSPLDHISPTVWLILGVWPVAVRGAPRPRPVLRWQRPRHHHFPSLPLPLSSPPPASPAAIVPRRAHRPLALTEPRHRICQPPSPPSPPPSPPLLSPPPSPPLPSPLTTIAAALATPSPFVRPACGHVATHVARTATRSGETVTDRQRI